LNSLDERNPLEMQGRLWLVSGRVQGVGFRWYVLQAARRCGVKGNVRNLSDGRVEVRVTGSASRLASLLYEIRKGPRSSRVDDVLESMLDANQGFDEFTVRH
jgi:acylphosphatase